MSYFPIAPFKTSQLYALLVTIFILSAAAPAVLFAQDDNIPEDAEAHLFMTRCFNCHEGVLTGRELINTSARPVENLEETVRRMQAYTGTLTEEQIAALVSLMKDEEFIFRLEDAKLDMEMAGPLPDVDESGAPIDQFARLYVQSCAICHSVGGGSSPGGDLSHTLNWDTARLQGEVSRMQDRVGPLTDEQIAGLTELLKDNNRMQRLQSVGYKPSAASATPTPRPSIEEQRDAAVAAKVAEAKAASGSAPHEAQSFPVGLLLGITIFTVIVGIGGYFIIVRNEEQ